MHTVGPGRISWTAKQDREQWQKITGGLNKCPQQIVYGLQTIVWNPPDLDSNSLEGFAI